jgi:uncharacterized membrane protein YphA (DoxX/SURF4 family)
MSVTANRFATALSGLRIYTGIAWLIHGIGKLTSPDWAIPGGECEKILQGMSGETVGAYHDFVFGVVIPHVTLFATMVEWGETLTGAALLLGLFARLGGAGGAFLALNYWAAKQPFTHIDAYAGLDLAMVALSIVNLVVPTGLVMGLDGVIASARKRKQ